MAPFLSASLATHTTRPTHEKHNLFKPTTQSRSCFSQRLHVRTGEVVRFQKELEPRSHGGQSVLPAVVNHKRVGRDEIGTDYGNRQELQVVKRRQHAHVSTEVADVGGRVRLHHQSAGKGESQEPRTHGNLRKRTTITGRCCGYSMLSKAIGESCKDYLISITFVDRSDKYIRKREV